MCHQILDAQEAPPSSSGEEQQSLVLILGTLSEVVPVGQRVLDGPHRTRYQIELAKQSHLMSCSQCSLSLDQQFQVLACPAVDINMLPDTVQTHRRFVLLDD